MTDRTRIPAESANCSGVGETGWLVEFPQGAHGGPLWAMLATNKWPRHASLPIHRGKRALTLEYQTPIEYTKDSDEAIRFARKQDAEAFIALFANFLLLPVATEHAWSDGPEAASLIERMEGEYERGLRDAAKVARDFADRFESRHKNGQYTLEANTRRSEANAIADAILKLQTRGGSDG